MFQGTKSIRAGTGNSGWFFYVGCVLYRVIPSFAETETTGERYIEIQTLQCNKKVLRNQTKSDTLLKAQLKTCSIWKKGGLVQKNERPSGKWGENPPQLPLL